MKCWCEAHLGRLQSPTRGAAAIEMQGVLLRLLPRLFAPRLLNAPTIDRKAREAPPTLRTKPD